jgi:hypothetical protein
LLHLIFMHPFSADKLHYVSQNKSNLIILYIYISLFLFNFSLIFLFPSNPLVQNFIFIKFVTYTLYNFCHLLHRFQTIEILILTLVGLM